MISSQSSLFAPYSNDSTSKAAARSQSASKIETDEGRILDVINRRDGCTCDMVEIITGLSHQTASARIRGLVLKGLLYDSGSKQKTRRNRNAIVWRSIR